MNVRPSVHLFKFKYHVCLEKVIMNPPGDPNDNIIIHIVEGIKRILDGPVVWVRENIVEPNQQKYPWYHKKYRRVPTVDQCYERDVICIWEADQQFVRDRLVDESILNIIRHRFEDCMQVEEPDATEKCEPLKELYLENMGNYFAKYGDMHAFRYAKTALMKQKHRMLWERRYGPVGTGMNPKAKSQGEEESKE